MSGGLMERLGVSLSVLLFLNSWQVAIRHVAYRVGDMGGLA
jgi:hypothetical protein